MRRTAPATLLAAAMAALIAAAAIAAGAVLAAAEPVAKTIGAGNRPPHYCPRGGGDFNANRLIGRKLHRARDLANAHGCTVRVVKRNGEGLIITEDFSPTRIDLAVWGNRVTGIDGIY